jgi:hypothetical protein
LLCDMADWKCDKAVLEAAEKSKIDRRVAAVTPPDVEQRLLDVRADQSFN